MATRKYSNAFRRSRFDAIYADVMAQLYGLTALGIAIIAATSWFGEFTGIGNVVYGFGWVGLVVAAGAFVGVILGAAAAVGRGHIGLGAALFVAFAGMAGLIMSPIQMVFTNGTIGVAFLLTASVFVAMSVVGMTTKKDLSKRGPVSMIGLGGVVIISLINIFLLRSDTLFLFFSIILLPLFLALTVWETKHMKELAEEAAITGGGRAVTQVAVIGSIGLYVWVVSNLFIFFPNPLAFLHRDNRDKRRARGMTR